MACMTLFTCDFAGCLRALYDDDVSHLQVYVHHPGALDGPPRPDQALIVDLCQEHLDVVLGRVLTSTVD